MASAISVLLFVSVILGALFGTGLIFVSQIARLADNLPEYTAIIQVQFANLTEFLHSELNALPAGTMEKANEYFALFTDQLAGWLKFAFSHVLAFLTSFSSFIVSFAISIILAFFLSSEIVWWKKVGNTGLAIGLIVLLAVVMLTRQLLEPKIAGNSIGISSAYLMLSFVLISTSLFGMAGLILAPILLILIKELLQEGYLQRWIRMPQEEFAVHPLSPSGAQATPPPPSDPPPAAPNGLPPISDPNSDTPD